MSKKKSLLVEIGSEELPPSLINNLVKQLKDNIITHLNELDIPFNPDIKEYSSPRRLAVIINDIPEIQEEKEVEIKGPPKNKAFDDAGKPTQVAIGFSNKYNLTPEKLTFKNINNIEYIFIKTKTGGSNVNDLLKEIIPKSIKNITGDKLMRWGDNNEKFIRPIRWIVALFGNKVINFKYADVESGSISYGHRFLFQGSHSTRHISGIEVSASTYVEDLKKKGNVFVDLAERKERIDELLKNKCSESGSTYETLRHYLKDVVVNITEAPSAVVCEFDKEFLNLPEIVVETVLDKHQKYFVLRKGKQLTNKFIVITNGTDKENEESKNNITKGNQKVARARLNDIAFFYKDDQKRPFTYEERVGDLAKVTFQKGLGSMKEKATRIINLSQSIYNELKNSQNIDCSEKDVIQAAKLCKLDLITQMVFEMPELQGQIGAIYAENIKESAKTCNAIRDHYLLTSLENTAGNIISIADKIDNLICLFSINKIPTSSSDPFGLIIQTELIIHSIEFLARSCNIELNLIKLLKDYKNIIICDSISKNITDETIESVIVFITERAKLMYKKQNSSLPVDLIDAAFAINSSLENLSTISPNIRVLEAHFKSPSKKDKEFLVAAKRLVRIVKDSSLNGGVKEDLLKTEDEKTLYKQFNNIKNKKSESKEKYFNSLLELTKPINNFFDNVLVNDPDPAIKQNRHSLLLLGKNLLEEICDFNQIVERN